MKYLAEKIQGIVCVACLLLSMPAVAIPIPVAASASGDVLFDFNCPACVLATAVSLEVSIFAEPGKLETGSFIIDWYGELGGSGPIIQTGSPINPLPDSFFESDSVLAGIMDGVFSVGFRQIPGTPGSGSIDLGIVEGNPLDGRGHLGGTTINGQLHVSSVPEAPALALLGVGLAALGFNRRRRE